MPSATMLPLLLLAAALIARASALTYCTGALSGDIKGDIAVVNGGVCALSANVSGDVYARNRSTLSLRDGAYVHGSVFLNESADLQSTGYVHVSGLDGINSESGGAVDIAGRATISRIGLKNNAEVSLRNANISADGFKVELGRGPITMCDSSIMNVIELKDVNGDFTAAEGEGCGKNKFLKDVKMEGVFGAVKIDGTDIKGELTVKTNDGPLTVANATVFKTKIELAWGLVKLYNVDVKEAEIKECHSGVEIDKSRFYKLGCDKNRPRVSGADNIITLSSGQCSAYTLA